MSDIWTPAFKRAHRIFYIGLAIFIISIMAGAYGFVLMGEANDNLWRPDEEHSDYSVAHDEYDDMSDRAGYWQFAGAILFLLGGAIMFYGLSKMDEGDPPVEVNMDWLMHS